MSESALSRRVSEFAGVALFAATLIWLIALVSYTPTDPVWFFNNIAAPDVENFAGRIGAFVAETSFQLLGYAAYGIPLVLAVVGWHSFWCRQIDAGYTKAVGAVLFFLCSAALLSLAFSVFDGSARPFQAGGMIGEFVAGVLAVPQSHGRRDSPADIDCGRRNSLDTVFLRAGNHGRRRRGARTVDGLVCQIRRLARRTSP